MQPYDWLKVRANRSPVYHRPISLYAVHFAIFLLRMLEKSNCGDVHGERDGPGIYLAHWGPLGTICGQ